MNKQKNNAKGITLVALVITIIVLVILVGVTLSVTLNTGLINNSKTAVVEYGKEQKIEEQQIAKWDKLMKNTKNDSEVNSDFEKENIEVLFKNGYMTGIEIGTKVKDIELPENYEICNKDGSAIADSAKATTNVIAGMVIKKNNKEIGKIIVYGDVSGDSEIWNDDASIVNSITMNPNEDEYTEYQKIAGDINHDGVLNYIDISLLDQCYLNSAVIPDLINQNAVAFEITKFESRIATKTAYLNSLSDEFKNSAYSINIEEGIEWFVMGEGASKDALDILALLPEGTKIKKIDGTFVGKDNAENVEVVSFDRICLVDDATGAYLDIAFVK